MNVKNTLELIKCENKYILANRQIGLLFNITLSSIMMTFIPLAEDKEKKTLKTLMISTVSSVEYIIASIVAPLLIVSIVNVIILLITKPLFFSFFHVIIFLLICIFATIVSIIVGLIIGFLSKSQSQASMIAAPIGMGLIFIPFMATFLQNDRIVSGARFIYTNVIMSLVSVLQGHVGINVTINGVLNLVVTFIIGLYWAINLYQKNFKKV